MTSATLRTAVVAAIVSAAAAVGGQADQRPGDLRLPLSPPEALATLVVEPGYRVELVAAEPLVQSPVAIAFDENGALYVAENRGYPDPLEGEPARPPEGVIARLTDTDGDGRYETRTEFATGLGYPNGVMVWDGGVFVTAAPDLLYLKDTTGDGVADERRVVLTGFNTTATAQIRFSHPTLALDNWIYLTAGLNGGTVTAPAQPDRPAVTFQGSDSRFNPRTLAFELTGGRSQFCLTFDAAGRRFTCANRQPLWHAVIEPWHLARHPAYAFSQTTQEVAAFGAAGIVWPISADRTTASLGTGERHAGTFTAASGAYVHRGDAIVPGHEGSVFICESAQNLVQRQVLAADGVSFRSRPAREGAEFLASRDTWFRPVFATGGPDGALYIVDMYRKDIDHPSYVPEARRPALDFTAGKNRGRIYRLVPTGWDRPRERVALGAAPVDALVAALDHSNGWVRDSAQRLIVERQAESAVPLLRARAARPGAPGRTHALWTLDGLGALDPDLVARALEDPDAGVRENALRLAEPRVAASAALAEAVLRAARDAEPRVRLRAALALGNLPDARAVDALADLAAREGADQWMRAAVFSGLADRVDEFFAAVSARSAEPDVRRAILKDVAQVAGASAPVERALELVPLIASPDAPLAWQAATLRAMLDGLERRKMTRATPSPLRSLIDGGDTDAARSARQAIDAAFARAAPVASSADASIEEREGAIALVALDDWARAAPRLQALVHPREPGAVQVAAVRALGELPAAAGAVAWLLEPARVRQYTPQVYDAVLTVVLAREAGAAQLLDAVERGDLDGASIPPTRRSRLERHRNEAIAARAKSLFARAGGAPGGREAYDRLLPAVQARAGVAARGAPIFAAQCQACHTFRGDGGATGPDLSGIGAQGPDAILRHILVPDAEITAGYETYMVELQDGRTLAGRIDSEAAQSVTLRDASAALHTLRRADITSIARAPGSLMPGGFEQALSAQELADLIAYLTAP